MVIYHETRMMKDIRDVYLCQLVVLAIGVVGNVLSGVVWVTQIHYVGGAMFLLALSVSHSLTIIFRGIYSVQMLLDPTSCRAGVFLFLSDASFGVSSHLTVAIAIQRYLSLVHPFAVDRVCSKMRQVVVIACMIVLAVCERAFVADYAARGYRTCVSGGEEAKKEFVTTVRAFTAISFLPLLALVVCIVFLVRALRRTKEMNNPVMRRSRARAKRKITVMVVCVSATSALAYTMIQVTNFAVYRFEQRPSKSPMLAALAVTKDFAVVFAVSVNVFFYSFFSENFRDTVKKFWSDVLSMGRTVGQCLSRN